MSTNTAKLTMSKPADSDTDWGGEIRGAMDILDSAVFSHHFAEDSASHDGLDFYYKSGVVRQGTTVTAVVAGHVSLADDDTSYIELEPSDGTVSDNVTGFTAGKIPLFEVLTAAGAISSVTDKRAFLVDKLTELSEDTTPELGGELDCGAHSIGFTETDNGDSSTADTIDWRLSNKQKSTLTDACTFTFTAPSNPCNLLLRLIQDGTGSRTVTWPATVKWPGGTAPTLTTDANAVDIVSFYYDGTNYYGVASLDFSVPA